MGSSWTETAQAEIAACIITGNAGDGIRGMRNARLDIGTDATGSTPQFDDDTNTGTNAGFGVRCMIGGFVDGRLGSLTGTGRQEFRRGLRGQRAAVVCVCDQPRAASRLICSPADRSR